MADLILNLLFFGGGMVFGMLLQYMPTPSRIRTTRRSLARFGQSAVTRSFQSTSFASRPCRSISVACGIDHGDRSCQVAGMNF
jgi:hypothetical protein